MTKVALNDFLTDTKKYIAMLSNTDIILTEKSKENESGFVAPAVKEDIDYAQRLREMIGVIDFPEDFDLEKFKSDRLWDKHVNID